MIDYSGNTVFQIQKSPDRAKEETGTHGLRVESVLNVYPCRRRARGQVRVMLPETISPSFLLLSSFIFYLVFVSYPHKGSITGVDRRLPTDTSWLDLPRKCP